MEFLFTLGFAAALCLVGYIFGTSQEKKHFASIREREEALRNILVIPDRNPPDINQRPYQTEFVCGNVVIAMDYFKMTFGSLKMLFGGNIGFYETLVERARREAVLRMKEEAHAKQAQMVFNIKFSTANIMSGNRQKAGGCVEAIAYGTAIIYK